MSEAQPEQQEQKQQPMPKWGDPLDSIPPERQAELRALAERQQAWVRSAPDGKRDLKQSAFRGVSLTGAEVFFLAAYALTRPEGDLDAQAARLRAVKRYVPETWLNTDLSALHLERADLSGAQLQGADLSGAQLQGADLSVAQLQGTDLGRAQLQGARLFRAALQGADLIEARLQGANLVWAELQGAVIRGALLRGATLVRAALQGGDLSGADLQGATLFGATLDKETTLTDAIILEAHDERSLLVRLLRHPRYGPGLGDLHWGDFDLVQLTQLRGWEALRRLADERSVSWRRDADGHRVAVRAYRQVAQRLRDQGLSEVADRLTERAQVRQRKLLFRQLLEDWRHPWRLPGDLARWLFSWFLALLAGYGYHPGRSVFWYLATIAGFTVLYMQATTGWIPFGLPAPSQLAPLPWYEALILSVSSFHGRGFFQPLASLGDPVAALAAIEAVLGLVIEVSFIATFAQRFFGLR